jgi:hypothetical protein
MARLAAVIGEVFCVGGGMLWWRVVEGCSEAD